MVLNFEDLDDMSSSGLLFEDNDLLCVVFDSVFL